jgi:uncharacterized protein YecE (DUF72 family)
MSIFYPPKMPGDEQLPFYGQRFDTVEINFSFYRLPERAVFERWREATSPDFLFAVKASRYLTHMKKLKDPEEPLQRLMEHAGGLGEKLGPILFQFPAKWGLNLERLAYFVEELRAYPGHRWAFEFRHPSWLTAEVYALLDSLDAALCLPVHPKMPLDVRLTATWIYIRMHYGQEGWGFTDAELVTWGERIRGFRAAGADVYIYFNNDPGGHALTDAKRLSEILLTTKSTPASVNRLSSAVGSNITLACVWQRPGRTAQSEPLAPVVRVSPRESGACCGASAIGRSPSVTRLRCRICHRGWQPVRPQ